MNIRNIGWEGVDWIHLAQDKDHWREYCNKPSGSINGGEFPGQLSDYYLLKNDPLPWSWLVGWLVGFR
jgi:hypothetical protein